MRQGSPEAISEQFSVFEMMVNPLAKQCSAVEVGLCSFTNCVAQGGHSFELFPHVIHSIVTSFVAPFHPLVERRFNGSGRRKLDTEW